MDVEMFISLPAVRVVRTLRETAQMRVAAIGCDAKT
jgi:hypothetical protein